MSVPRWLPERNIEFIKFYKEKENLWNPKHKQYKNREVREASYSEIMHAMKMESIKEVASRIRILRNTYCNVMARAKKRPGGTYVPKIPWLKHLAFVENINANQTKKSEKKPVTNGGQTTQHNESNAYILVYGEPQEESFIVDTPTPIIIQKVNNVEDPLMQVDNRKEPIVPLPTCSDNVSMGLPTFSNMVSEGSPTFSNKDFQGMIPSQPFGNDNDEFGLFGRTVAEQLRQLPLEVALETEEIILSTIRKQRLKTAAQESSDQGLVYEIKQEP